ncbi:class I SAM-dependent methyltransferase [Domibacillus indicus]|uniref:class I SAM-dependent methyltransferase n=1 Tax=Domibacillus indicus TaxID=1437523 RepID=UPI000617CBFC|nr:class I SAM-dependent methyltransferase [Domibacillus indicus]
MKQNIYDNDTFFNGYMTLRKSGVTYNDFIEQPAIKSVLPPLHGKTVLDVGCGMGQFAAYCVENGAASVLGIDISEKMIEQAQRSNPHPGITYRCVPIEDFESPGQSFDLIVSSLAIHYVEDYPALVGKVSGLLRGGGEFIFSTEHPVATARQKMNNWVRDEEGNRLHWALDNYQEEGMREQHWYIDGVIKYHRTLSTLVNTLITGGLAIEKMVEPQSIPAGLEQMPDVANEKRRPSFLIIQSKKRP